MFHRRPSTVPRWASMVLVALLGACQALQGETPCAGEDECPAGFTCDLASGICRALPAARQDASVDAAIADRGGLEQTLDDRAAADHTAADAGAADRGLPDASPADLGPPDQASADHTVGADHGDGDRDAASAVDSATGEDSGPCGSCPAALPICGPADVCVQCTHEGHCQGRACVDNSCRG